MAKEATSTRALTGPRILNQPVPSYIGSFTAGSYPGSNGWESFNGGVYNENYFDLSGYELDDLTAFPTGIMLQDALPYSCTNAPSDLFMSVFDIISQERLNPETIINLLQTLDYPSSPGSTLDWSQMLLCNYRAFTTQNDFQTVSTLLPVTGGALGSNEPTAVQKLWTYRIVAPAAIDLDNTTINIPATRFVLNAVIAKEDDLEYMMRLKRSYELSTQG